VSYGRGKKDNAYAQELLDIEAPKTVFMAIAFSLAQRITEDAPADITHKLIWDEWQTLYDNGIVPQKPRRSR
jgi:hypothetical protein